MKLTVNQQKELNDKIREWVIENDFVPADIIKCYEDDDAPEPVDETEKLRRIDTALDELHWESGKWEL